MSSIISQTVKISIHALRGEGDQYIALPYFKIHDFNPRPPWGGRHVKSSNDKLYVEFQSTPSVGRATRGTA